MDATLKDIGELIGAWIALGGFKNKAVREEIHEILLHINDVLEREWFPDRERTSEMRRWYKQQKRGGMVK